MPRMTASLSRSVVRNRSQSSPRVRKMTSIPPTLGQREEKVPRQRGACGRQAVQHDAHRQLAVHAQLVDHIAGAMAEQVEAGRDNDGQVDLHRRLPSADANVEYRWSNDGTTPSEPSTPWIR